MSLVSALAISFLAGSIPTAYLLVKSAKGIDVRSVASGNVGATNAARAAGKWVGLIVFVLDVAKGLVAVLVIAPWLIAPLSKSAQLGCGLAAVAGHSFTPFLRFRGGKGVSTTIGMLLGAAPLVALLCLCVWGVFFALWRYVSVASIAAAVAFPVLQVATQQSPTSVLVGAALAILVVIRHHGNIKRLLQGCEHRVDFTGTKFR